MYKKKHPKDLMAILTQQPDGSYRYDPEKARRVAYSTFPQEHKGLAYRKRWLNDLKSVPCADCGWEYPPECMDFDHVKGEKLKNVSALIGAAQEILEEEIEKCEVVCANCHRIRTKSRRD